MSSIMSSSPFPLLLLSFLKAWFLRVLLQVVQQICISCIFLSRQLNKSIHKCKNYFAQMLASLFSLRKQFYYKIRSRSRWKFTLFFVFSLHWYLWASPSFTEGKQSFAKVTWLKVVLPVAFTERRLSKLEKIVQVKTKLHFRLSPEGLWNVCQILALKYVITLIYFSIGIKAKIIFNKYC